MITFEQMRTAREREDVETFLLFVEKLFSKACGHGRKRDENLLSNMESFNGMGLTIEMEAFTLFTIQDKEAVWKHEVDVKEATGKVPPALTEEMPPSPKYTSSNRFTGGEFSFKDIDAGLEALQSLITQVEENRNNEAQNNKMLEAVKVHFKDKVEGASHAKRKRREREARARESWQRSGKTKPVLVGARKSTAAAMAFLHQIGLKRHPPCSMKS